jgi:hypothetical protein
MQNQNEDRMPDPLDFVPGQKTGPISTVTNNSLFTAPPKKRGVVVNVLTTILLIPIIIVGIIVVTIFGFSLSHGSELNKLKKETTSLFSSSNFTQSAYDCHDVELKNTCYFTLSENDSIVESFLLSQGFSKNATYGKGYQKDDLYIDNNSKGTYSSFYVK